MSVTAYIRKGLSAGLLLSALSLPVLMAGMEAAQGQAASFSGVERGVSDHFLYVVSTDQVGKGAREFVDGMAQRAINFLGDEKLDQDQKQSKFRTLLQDSFDMETIGRFALGRYWRVATPGQRKEYQRLFRDMVVKVYSDRFKEYKGQKVDVRSVRVDGEKDALVTSFIVSEDGPEVQVDWRVRYKDGKYRIIDVIVEGVSMSVTQRSDFASVIQRGGGDVEVLLAHLKQ